MKNRIVAWVATFVMILGSLMAVSVVTASSAAAVDGCTSEVVLKVDGMSADYTYYTGGPEPDWHDMRVVTNTFYWYCPNGTKDDKIKVKYNETCYTHLEDDWGIRFDGVKANYYFADDLRDVNPGEFKVPDDGSWQNCKTQDIPLYDEKWMKLKYSAHWKAKAGIDLKLRLDDWHNMQYEGKEYKFFRPLNDPNMGSWHN